MASNLERIRKACEETKRLYGIPEEKVKAVLKNLLNFYGNAWSTIEKNNYKAILECALGNNKEGEDETMVYSKRRGVLLIQEGKKLEPKTVHILSDDESDDPERSLKRRKRNYNEKALTSAEPSLGRIGDVKRSRPAIPRTVTDANGRALFIKNGNVAELLTDGKDNGEGNLNKQPSGHEPVGSQDIVSKVRQHEYVDVFNEDVGNSSVKIEKKIIDACNGGNSSFGSEGKMDRLPDYHRQCSNSSKVTKNSIFVEDITRGEENEPIPLVGDKDSSLELPKFFYISRNIVYNKAYVNFSLARISDHNCCSNCSGDCLSAPANCACTGETRGDFAYTRGGLVEEKFLDECIGMSRRKPNKEHLYYCENCPLENSSLVANGKQQKRKKSKNACKGHLMRKFIKECWTKCGCSRYCGNRVVQRGITVKLQVFQTPQGKGWGLQTLQDLEKGTFVCEYVGEIVTNLELHERNEETAGGEHTYPVLLDADWASERHLKDEEALCLDATKLGNVARFINHRCYDANLVEIPVEVETPDHHYYHIAFFTSRRIEANEELTWDYGIDFDDETHPIKAFECKCGSHFCGMKNVSSR